MSAPDPIRVLHVVNSLEPGGMENGVANIARALESRGVETHVACVEQRGRFAERLPHPENVFVLGKRQGFSLPAAVRLARRISALRPDVVHSHNLGALIYTSLATLGGLRVPVLHGEHSQLTPDELRPKRLRQRRWLYRGCKVVHTVANGSRDELIALGFPERQIVTLTNGVDTQRFTPGDRRAARERFGIPADALVVGIVGRFGPFKGHGTLIAAIERLVSSGMNVRLFIAGGGGSEQARVEERSRSSACADRIHLAGFQADPLACYQAIDLLAIPSTNEGLSNALLEAMSCGVPALGNADCGHEQVVTSGSDGLIADLRTPEALAGRLSELLADPEKLRSMGVAARRRVEDAFSISSMTAAYEELYRRLSRTTPR